MMKTSTTLLLLVIALVLGIAALFAVPASVEPEAFSDQGELLFPEFTDPLACKEIAVYDPNADTGEVEIFSVKYEQGLYRIPSHHGYPADAKDRMAAAASAVIGLKKDTIRSDRVEDRAVFGVEDPLDSTASLEGRGKRVVMKDASGRTLADVIVGKEVEDRVDWAYMRQPKNKRIYAVNVKGEREGAGELIDDISTNFSEWIDTDLLHLERREINGLTLRNYSVDETRGTIDDQETLTLVKGEDGKWTMEELFDNEQVKESNVRTALNTLDDLTIAGVRPTPERLSQFSLMSKGFFLNQEGDLFGNEGHLEVHTDQGVIYYLFFGEILFGSGEAVTAGSDQQEGDGQEGGSEEEEKTGGENRYLFVRVGLDPEWEEETAAAVAAAEAEAEEQAEQEAGRPGEGEGAEPDEGEGGEADEDVAAGEGDEKSENQKKREEWEEKLEKAKERVNDLNLRFKQWYYVISADSFEKLRLSRGQLTEVKVPDTSSIGEQPETKTDPVKRPSGLAYIDLADGSGSVAVEGDTVKVLYTGWLTDGTSFDSNTDRENPFTFTLGEGQVIKGWDEGIEGMQPGAKRKLIIPPDLGYGEQGQGDKIPPDAYLVFDVEVLEVVRE